MCTFEHWITKTEVSDKDGRPHITPGDFNPDTGQMRFLLTKFKPEVFANEEDRQTVLVWLRCGMAAGTMGPLLLRCLQGTR
jgi:hypothetical protein